MQRLAAHDIFHGGEARRKRLKVRTKSTKTRSSPRRFWKSRSRSPFLHRAPGRQLAMRWATPGWGRVAFAAAPLLKRGVAKAMPLVGDRVRSASHPHRSPRHPLRRRLFASAPAHAPAAASIRRARRFTPRRAPDLVALHPRPHLSPPSSPPPPVAPLAATAIAPQSRQWCACVWPWLCACAVPGHVYTAVV